MLRSMALAGVIGIILLPRGEARGGTPAPAGATASANASAAPPSPGARPRVSPYTLAARRQAEAARAGHAPAVPPSMKRTRRATSRVPPR